MVSRLTILLLLLQENAWSFSIASRYRLTLLRNTAPTELYGWVQSQDGEWEWEETDEDRMEASALPVPSSVTTVIEASATPQLPSGSYKPKQSLGQNYLKDPNTVAKIIRAFDKDARQGSPDGNIPNNIIELGPGAGALTDKLVEVYGAENLQCIEIDERSVGLLQEKHPHLRVYHQDVLQANYAELAEEQPLAIIGNLPYYITSQILFALADASHVGAVSSATVTMQWEVAQRIVAVTNTKDYGILSVVFQLYANVNCHFKIPPTVFYPKPKVDSALVGLHFIGPTQLRKRLAGVKPTDLRRVVTTAFQQRRKTIRNSLKKLVREVHGGSGGDDNESVHGIFNGPPSPLPESIQMLREQRDMFATTQELPADWASMRPEQLTAGQFVEITRRIFGPEKETEESMSASLGTKVWRKLKHGTN